MQDVYRTDTELMQVMKKNQRRQRQEPSKMIRRSTGHHQKLNILRTARLRVKRMMGTQKEILAPLRIFRSELEKLCDCFVMVIMTNLCQENNFFFFIIIIIINPLTARIVGAPQMILQPVFSILPFFPLPSGTCRTPGLPIP